MFYNLFHRLLIPALVTAIVCTIWVIGWSQTVVQEAERGYWPALHARQQPAQSPAEANNSASPTSFH